MTGARIGLDPGAASTTSAQANLRSDLGSGLCQIWGILNITPDSFSDGGRFLGVDSALQQARRLAAQGADVLDIGGASSRPAGRDYGAGAATVTPAQELDRIMPVVEAVKRELPITISVDTTQAEVARAALSAGVHIINDVSCAAHPDLLAATAAAGAEYVLMHNRGDGRVSGDHIRYDDVVEDVCVELAQAVNSAVAAGISRNRIWLDPGLGFAKTVEQSVALLAATERLVACGQRLLVGPSRKGFIGVLGTPSGQVPPAPPERDGGTVAAVTVAAVAGAHAVRVHDVKSAYQAVRLVAAVSAARRTS